MTVRARGSFLPYLAGTQRYPYGTVVLRASLVAAHPSVAPHLDARTGAQRARLLEAMTQAVAEKGYTDATVADAVRAARVSRGTFYAQFASKEECFLEAYRHGVEVLEERIDAAVRRAAGDWRARLRAGLRAFLDCLADEPAFARTWMIEIHAAGHAAQAARDATLRRFAQRYRASFEASGARRLPGDDALFVLAAGVDQLVCARLRAGALDDLDALTDTLLNCAVAQLEGAAAAEEGAA
jgi:AcrR family transcriptional regulator